MKRRRIVLIRSNYDKNEYLINMTNIYMFKYDSINKLGAMPLKKLREGEGGEEEDLLFSTLLRGFRSQNLYSFYTL